MLTVLFAFLILAAFNGVFSAFDDQYLSREINSYLHAEYRMEIGVPHTFATLRSL